MTGGDWRIHHSETPTGLVDPDARLAPHQVLQAFDRARCLLAMRENGTEGAFVGYQTLEISADAICHVEVPSGLTVTALVL